ncbi:MAG: phosphoribosyl-ATP diphosphatase [Pseudomonadota bacterium]
MTQTTPLGDAALLAQVLSQLSGTIDARAGGDETVSYTTKLIGKGPIECGKKLGEEAVELALALAAQPETEIANEAADLLYHLFVGLRCRGVPLDAVAQALAARQGQSGLEEKASRAPG